MANYKLWAGLMITVGLLLTILWFPIFAPGLMDCWIGAYCTIIMIPLILGIILIVGGFVFLFIWRKRQGDMESN